MIPDFTSLFTTLKGALDVGVTLYGADEKAKVMVELALSLYEDVTHARKQFADYGKFLDNESWIKSKIDGAQRALDCIGKIVAPLREDFQIRGSIRFDRRFKFLYNTDEINNAVQLLENAKASLLSANSFFANEALRRKLSETRSAQMTTVVNLSQVNLQLPSRAPALSRPKSSIDLKRPKKRSDSTRSVSVTEVGTFQSLDLASIPLPESLGTEPLPPSRLYEYLTPFDNMPSRCPAQPPPTYEESTHYEVPQKSSIFPASASAQYTPQIPSLALEMAPPIPAKIDIESTPKPANTLSVGKRSAIPLRRPKSRGYANPAAST